MMLNRNSTVSAAPVDMMGMGAGLTTFGAASLAYLGWGQGVLAVPGDHSGDYTVELPVLSGDGPDAVVVDDPVSGARYSLTYLYSPAASSRAGTRAVPAARSGVYVSEVLRDGGTPAPGGERPSFSLLLPWGPHPHLSGVGALAGAEWISPGGGVGLEVLATGAGSATLRIRVSPAHVLPPTLTSQGGSLRLSLSAAWNQSGVTSYRVTTSSGPVASVCLRDPLATSTVRIPAWRQRAVTVTVTATDSAGITSTWACQARSARR